MKRQALVVVFGLLIPAVSAAQRPSSCLTGDEGAGLIIHLKQWMTVTDTADVRLRNTVYRIPVVDTAAVQLVTDARTCARAAAAYPDTTADRPVYVVSLGREGYAVLDPSDKAGEFRTVILFNRQWKEIGGWTGP